MSLEEFSPHVGESYLASEEAGGSPLATLVLLGAERSPYAGEGDRPFSLVFQAPVETPLGQDTYWLARVDDEPQPVFLVPIAPDRYEAIFN